MPFFARLSDAAAYLIVLAQAYTSYVTQYRVGWTKLFALALSVARSGKQRFAYTTRRITCVGPRAAPPRCVLWITLFSVCSGCTPSGQSDPSLARITVYCSVDEAFARPILNTYEKNTGRRIDVVFDSEAGKTTGLVQRIMAEAESGRPRGSVFFSSEVFNTILLARRGLLEAYDPPTAADIPERFRDARHRWTAFAARARVLAFDPSRTAATSVPHRWEELAAARFASRTAMANPLFGTTRGHAAAMFALWGTVRARAFLTALRDNGALIVDGNSASVRALMNGRVAYAMTDSDDVWSARRTGASLDLRYLDMGNGILLIPCSVAIIKGGPNTDRARELVDYLVSADVERLLAKSTSRNVPVRAVLRDELGIHWPTSTPLSFNAIADSMDEAVKATREILIR